MKYQLILSIIAITIGIACYIPYIIDIFKNKTKPHAYTWFLWTLIAVIAFSIQFQTGGGVGSFTNFFAALVCGSIFIISLKKGEKKITIIDNICLAIAFIAVIIWLGFHNNEIAIIFVIIADVLGFAITFIKTYKDPFSETNSTYIITGIKWLLTFFAMETFTFTTIAGPTYLIICNFGFAIMVIIRRKTVKNRKVKKID